MCPFYVAQWRRLATPTPSVAQHDPVVDQAPGDRIVARQADAQRIGIGKLAPGEPVRLGQFVVGVILWFALLCAIGALFEIGREKARERRRAMRRRVNRHVFRR